MALAFHYSLCLLTQLILLETTSSRATYVYDGVSTVQLTGAQNDGSIYYNWTMKYPLGELCEDPNWVTSVNIAITKLSDQGDLVLAFGSSTEYFALTIPYDNLVWIPLGTKPRPEEHRSGLSVAPQPNSKLYITNSLEQQYTTDSDFRRSLIPNKNESEWHKLIDAFGPMSVNSTRLTLRIFGDRRSNITQLTIIKNGVNVTTHMSSTWGHNTRVFLYMGMDAAKVQKEVFVISGIERVDECTWQTLPRTPSPTLHTWTPSHMPTPSPSDTPSRAPSESTANPTVSTADPSVKPTDVPTVSPSWIPSKMPSMVPSLIPSFNPSDGPSQIPSHVPSVLPSYAPTPAPNQAIVITNVGGEVYGSVSVDEEEGNEEEEVGVDTENINVFELIETGEWTKGKRVIYVGISVAISVVCIVLLVIGCCYKCRKSYSVVEDYDNW